MGTAADRETVCLGEFVSRKVEWIPSNAIKYPWCKLYEIVIDLVQVKLFEKNKTYFAKIHFTKNSLSFL